MDRIRVCGTRDAGSIPAKGTKIQKKHLGASFVIFCSPWQESNRRRISKFVSWTHISKKQSDYGNVGFRPKGGAIPAIRVFEESPVLYTHKTRRGDRFLDVKVLGLKTHHVGGFCFFV